MEAGGYEELGIVKFNGSMGWRDLDVDGRVKFFDVESFKYGKTIGIRFRAYHGGILDNCGTVEFYFMGVKSMLLRGSGTEVHGKSTRQGCGSKAYVCVILVLTVTMGTIRKK